MPPSAGKTNLRSYEAQARLLRAVVAAHPNVSWNFKEIAACYGSDITTTALDHRFRPFRVSNLIIKLGREQGFDMKDLLPLEQLPKVRNQVDTDDIAKYFGQSTPGGLEFHFRSVKGDAKKMKEAADNGEDPCSVVPFSTPAKKSTKSTPPTTGSGRKRGRPPTPAVKRDDSDSSDDIANYEELDESPSKRLKQERDNDEIFPERKTPTKPGQKPVQVRQSAANAMATIQRAQAVLALTSSEDDSANNQQRKPLPTRPRPSGKSQIKPVQKDPFCDNSTFQLKEDSEEADGN